MKFIKITCPSCGDTFDPPENQPFAFCRSCGSKIVIEREPQTDPTPNLELGKQYLRAGNYKEADEQFSRALEKDPNFREAWFWKGITAICQHGPNRRDWGLAPSYLQKSAILDSQIVEMLASVLAGDSQWLSVSQFFTATNRTVAIDVLKYAPSKDALWLLVFSNWHKTIASLLST